MKILRLIFVLSSPVVLSGCAGFALIPLPITIASYAGDGVSYLATGKSMTDHAISDAMSQDCAMHRVLRLKNPCHDFTYREDESRIRQTHLRENFAWLNRFTLSLLKQHPSGDSLAMKRRCCGWNAWPRP